MLFNLRLASNSMHLMARNLNWTNTIKVNAVQSARNYVTQNPLQIERNFISRQLKHVNRAQLSLLSLSLSQW